MKRIIFSIISILLLSGLSSAAQSTDRLVTYPMPPDSVMELQPRCDFIISRYWQRCKFDYAMLHRDKFNEAFGEWVTIMPHASADTVHAAIDKLIGLFEKKGPETLALAEMARNWLYSDTARFRSYEIYMPFAKAASMHKKIKKEEKALYAADDKRMSASSVGAVVPGVETFLPDGSKSNLDMIKGGSVLLFFNEPDNIDCSIARIKLSSDRNVRELVDRGELTVVCIHPSAPDDNWKAAAESLPEKWHKVAMPETEDYFDIRYMPQFIYLNGEHKVLASNLDLSYLLSAFATANDVYKNRAKNKGNE